MERQTQTCTIRKLHFAVDTAGPASGPLVLMLHGFRETRHMWRHQLSAVAGAGFRAVAPDQRGYSRGARPLEVEAYATEQLTGDRRAGPDRRARHAALPSRRP